MVRRVVTANDAAGRAIIASDEVIEPVVLETQPGSDFRLVWGSDRPVQLPSDRTPPNASWIPPAGGFRFGLSVLPPDTGTVPADATAMRERLDEVRAKLPGLAEALEADHPGMHTTDTLDTVFVVDGEVERARRRRTREAPLRRLPRAERNPTRVAQPPTRRARSRSQRSE